MNLLIIEDDQNVIDLLLRYFKEEGWDVFVAKNKQESIDAFRNNIIDIVLLDWMLGGEDGLELGKELREVSDVPIIMLTSRSDKNDITKALDAGADDYLVKPFSVRELEARIKSVMRRAKIMTFKNTNIAHGNININIKEKEVRVNNEPVSLTDTEYKILTYLVLKRETLLSKSNLEKHVFKNNYRSSHLINMHIVNLRKKLKEAITIHTIPSIGYQLR